MTRQRRFAAPIRLREDTGWEVRCEHCALRNRQCFWPLDEEFWDFKAMSMCKACHRDTQARRKRERSAIDPAYATHLREQGIAWRKDNTFKQSLNRKAEHRRIMDDPARHEALLAYRRRPQAELYRDHQRRLAYQREWRRRRSAGESTKGIVEWLNGLAA